MFHTCIVKFDVTRNLKKFLNFACCSLQVALATSGWLWLPQRVASWRTARRSRPDGDEQGLSDFFFFPKQERTNQALGLKGIRRAASTAQKG
jgi:hypothetical protein